MAETKVFLKCKICGFITPWDFSLSSHVKNSHRAFREEVFNCNLVSVEQFLCPDWVYRAHLKVAYDNDMRRRHHWDNLDLIYVLLQEINPEQRQCQDCGFKTFSCFLAETHECKQYTLKLKTEIIEGDVKDVITDSEIKRFSCDHCEYKSKRKDRLKLHLINRHKSSDFQTKWFYCQQCSYKSVYNNNLKVHVNYKHTSEEVVKWYYCDHCSHKAKYRSSLKKHVMARHTLSKEIKWFLCDRCEYKSKRKDRLKLHSIQRHKSSEQTKWFSCENCSYKSLYKQNLKSHVIKKHT